jgi:2TM domain
MPEPPPPTYTPEEAAEILKRALKQQSMKDQGLTHQDLVEMAAEVGIDRGALETATADVVGARADELARQTEARELAEERARLFNRFVSSLLVYVLVNTLLYLIDRKFTHGTWFYWVLFGWGIGLAFQLRSVFFPRASLESRKRHELRRAMKAERRAARHARRQRIAQVFGAGQSHAAHAAQARNEFEAAVQTGVAALMQAAARKIQEHAERASIDGAGSRRRR